MAGYEKNQERKQAMQLLGKDLARRAHSKCEMCEEGGLRLDPFEPPPAAVDPSLERTLLLCERCRLGAEGGKLGNDSEWRFLETIVWSEMTTVQVTAIRLLRRLRDAKVEWATSVLEGVYASPETEAWLGD